MPIIDLHCDTISEVHKKKLSLSYNNLAVDIEKLKIGDYLLQCFAVFINIKKVSNPYKECLDIIDTLYLELGKNKDIEIALSYKDIIKNYSLKKISAILSIEDSGILMGRLDNLDSLYKRGVRIVCLNWNYPNGVGYPNYTDRPTPNTELGLTEFGFELIEKMNKLGMIIDISHLSDKGFWDVIRTSKKPIIASHSNSRTMCNHVRNLTDEMIVALNKNGGVMGLNYYPVFLNDDRELGKNTIVELVKHIKYIKEIAGIDVIALGSDFDGFDDRIMLNNAAMMNELIIALKYEGFTAKEIEKITFRNALRVLKSVLD